MSSNRWPQDEGTNVPFTWEQPVMSALPQRTADEIQRLKSNWRSDPAWDIEDTEGFEAHRDELQAYRLQVEAEYEARRAQRIKDTAFGYGIPDNLTLALTIMHLEDRIRDFEQRIGALEESQP